MEKSQPYFIVQMVFIWGEKMFNFGKFWHNNWENLYI